ncbi:MAG: cysteine desulfurase NifS, partial [Proteobacteria bacterium]|nr:cysteine desulfurase NifS [Pseudomonadota bacterium]
RDLEANFDHMNKMTDLLYRGLTHEFEDVKLNGHPEKRLPNTLSLSFRNLEANRILEEIGLKVAASAGAACHSDCIDVSHVLTAMKIPLEWAKGTLRFTTGRMTTEAEIFEAVQIISDAVKKLNSNCI